MSNALRIFRGDTRLITVPVTLKSTGAVFDLTGYKAIFTVKKSANLPDSAAILQKTVNDIQNPTLGVINFELDENDTDVKQGNYTYDVQISNDTTRDIKTVVVDSFQIVDDVTKATLSALPD
jgi:hypothetical protein